MTKSHALSLPKRSAASRNCASRDGHTVAHTAELKAGFAAGDKAVPTRKTK